MFLAVFNLFSFLQLIRNFLLLLLLALLCLRSGHLGSKQGVKRSSYSLGGGAPLIFGDMDDENDGYERRIEDDDEYVLFFPVYCMTEYLADLINI